MRTILAETQNVNSLVSQLTPQDFKRELSYLEDQFASQSGELSDLCAAHARRPFLQEFFNRIRAGYIGSLNELNSQICVLRALLGQQEAALN